MSRKYDVYGIGNALVDIVTEVDEAFFLAHEIEKGVMTLVDEKRQHYLTGVIDMKKSQMACGGSAGNTVIAVSQFGGRAFYSCLVAKDSLGKFFLEDLRRNGVDTNLRYENCPEGITGKCLVMTSPDADRTMNTFLGISSFLAPEHLDEVAIRQSEYIYLEGYRVSAHRGRGALKEAARVADGSSVRPALTLSAADVVRYVSRQFEEVIGASVDRLFCNEQEALTMTGSDTLEDAREKLREQDKGFA